MNLGGSWEPVGSQPFDPAKSQANLKNPATTSPNAKPLLTSCHLVYARLPHFINEEYARHNISLTWKRYTTLPDWPTTKFAKYLKIRQLVPSLPLLVPISIPCRAGILHLPFPKINALPSSRHSATLASICSRTLDPAE